MKKYLLGAVVALILISCNEAAGDGTISSGSSSQIQCYSGGVSIYSGTADGDISTDATTGAYIFKDASDGKLKSVRGDCVIVYD